ncbi:alpha-glucosidase [Parvularcula maris]|uniref:Alpha-amylase family glycosyl hydrolase n=1 Tax=Parvularcula maris TaxID=2965077 RepID=A0A9X2LB35_9PROT|nr:alpha-glucosidase [Parvularcula maris]MCQ8186458.1 alpha-amylase family glycosyl hydrolase [Parvularcula maris]
MAQSWWRGGVLYQIYPRSFRDTGGDGIGDLPGITEKLPYLAKLGVDGVWLSPFFKSPMADYGYDVADYCDVDPMFGTLQDFDELLGTAHSLGLKIIIDQVYSHTSDQHAWFEESRKSRDNPKADWYVWADAKPDGTPPTNWLSVFGGSAWTWDARRRQYYLHNFLSEQPDLNFHNPEVQEAVLDVARFWLDRGVDGFRLDVANYVAHDQDLRDNPPVGTVGHGRPGQFQQHLYERSRPEALAFAERLREVLDSYPDKMSVAEIDSTSPLERAIQYTEGEVRYHTAYSFSLLRAPKLTPDVIRSSLEPYNRSGAWPSWSISNHDVRRAVSRWSAGGDDEELAKQLVILLLSLRGTIFLYQGDELGLPQAKLRYEDLLDPESKRFWPEDLGRDGARTPMPWQADAEHAGFSGGKPWMRVDERHAEKAADRQVDDPNSVFHVTKRFIATRRGSPALSEGSMSFLDLAPPLLGFERRAGNSSALFVFNLSGEEVRLAKDMLPQTSELVTEDLRHDEDEASIVFPPHGGLAAWLS